MQRGFQRIAIVNRGEAAMRFIHAAREFNQEHGTSLRTIGLFTEPDRHAMFVREADEALSLGPAHVIDPATQQAKSSYVDYGCLEKALVAARAEAVWVGWGFVAEHAEFADLCQRLGIVFIGPNGDVMRRLGDKISSKLLAEHAHVPVAPWSGGPVNTCAEAERHAERLGYPLLIKATAGGGGRGIRLVEAADQLGEALERARAEAFKAFGNSTVFIEKVAEGARHIEVQIIADHYGNTWAAGVRDCTIQRRHQKVVEEAPSPALTRAQDQRLRQAAVRLSQAAGYQNAGTVEFLYDEGTRKFAFMEMNTRLQVEHPVTECTTGLDLVKLQIHVARGGKLEGKPPRTVGHAIEVRLNAEDAENNFAPAPGAIERFKTPTGPGLRIDTGVTVGDSVPAEFDSMIAKIIAFGQNRDEALSRLQRALRETIVVIRGGASNKAFLLELLNRPEVKSAQVDVGWLDRLAADGKQPARPYADVALVQAAIEAYDAALRVEQNHFRSSAARGRPQVRSEAGQTIVLRHGGHSYSLQVSRLGPRQYRVESDGARADVHVDRLGPFEYWLSGAGRRFHLISVVQGHGYRIEVDGVAHGVDRDDGGVVHAPAPAVVVAITVKPGDTVAVGDRLAVLEAMKMEMQVVAPFAGKVRQILTIPNVQVAIGAPLVQLEPTDAEAARPPAERVRLGASFPADQTAEDPAARARQNLRELRQLMLGFDVDPKHIARIAAEWGSQSEIGNGDLRAGEDEILNIFVDICSLFQRNPAVDDPTGGQVPSSEAHLFTYLRLQETKGEKLPANFMGALRRLLAHYGVQSLERSPALEEGLLWIYKSHQRVSEQITPILAILERRLRTMEALQPQLAADASFRDLLDRISAMTRGLSPAVSDLAREVRYRCFYQPQFEQARRQNYEEAEAHLAYLAEDPAPPDRAERLQQLVECAQPLVGVLCGRLARASAPVRELLLELAVRRYYRVETLLHLERATEDGQSYVSAQYDDSRQRIHLFAAYCELAELRDAARKMFDRLERVAVGQQAIVDFYLWDPELPADPEMTQQKVQALLNQAGFTPSLPRVVAVVAGPGNRNGFSKTQVFTYTWSEQAYQEDKLYRGLHPMIGKRLNLWRFVNFKLERLPSVDDVYLFHATAHTNPKDQRLFACAEVRDMTAVRDGSGRILQLPHLERMLAETLAGIRLFQSRRSTQERLHWNRILLYAFPPLTLRRDELQELANKLVPETEGLGLEQVIVRGRIPSPATGKLHDMLVRISNPTGRGLLVTVRPTARLQPLKPLSEYDQKVVRMRQRGLLYPYEIIKLLTPAREDTHAAFPPGHFVEHDLDAENRLAPVDRPYGQNTSNIVAGVIRNFTEKHPEGMERVLLAGDPSRDLGALAEPECRRIMAALDLAEAKGVPVEWFPLSAGAKISMDSGVENMDWIARVLRRLVEFTQAGGEVNLLINGINVGAQPYWNAEASMLMHTRGILVMTPMAAMVLTGKQALDYSGSVSAEDNQGIGGYDRIMGPNGQAQYWARDIDDACHILLRHYDHTYLRPGERFPRRALTSDPVDRDIRTFPHSDERTEGFTEVGEIFCDDTNAGRKKSFDIRRVMLAVSDQDHVPLERWAGMQDAETAVVWDVHLGGYPVCLVGIESKPTPRLGFVPADGPDQWCAGTLFPMSSKKVARAINAASKNRPVVILANLSGFDGSPESLRKLQLEYGAEIGRAVVNFDGPMVFCVVSRYHGGAYVVFSRTLNENLEVVALEGSYASVIGGAPAAAVVFAREVETRARNDRRIQELGQKLSTASGAEKGRVRILWNELFKRVHSEKLGEVAAEFDRVHCVERALRVGALHRILPAGDLRPYLIYAVERGTKKVLQARAEALAYQYATVGNGEGTSRT